MSFLAMGGYAAYIWPAFGTTALVLAGLLLASLRSLRVRQATLQALQQDLQAARRGRGQAADKSRAEERRLPRASQRAPQETGAAAADVGRGHG